MKPYHEYPYQSRSDAGRKLTRYLQAYAGSGAVVLAIPRGGVPVGIEVAAALGCDLDIIVPRKIPIPGNSEAGYGAVTEDGVTVLNEPLVRELQLTDDEIREQAQRVKEEIRRRQVVFRAVLAPLAVAGKTAIVIDDGLASGYTMAAAVQSLKQRKAERVVAAAPVASESGWDLVRRTADDVVSPIVSSAYPFAVAGFYEEWYDLSDEEVIQYLEAFQKNRRRKSHD